MTKPNSSKNAVTHGFYATDVVLASENQQEFDDLLRAYQDEYCPDGVSEEAAVVELASLHWKKRRLEAGLKQALQQMGFAPVADASDPIGDMAREVTKSQLEVAGLAVGRLAKLAQHYNPDDSNGYSQALEFEKLTVALKEYNLGFKDLASSLRRAGEQKLADIEQAYFPDIMERELKIRAEIDRQIEKALKRLVMTKEYKRLYCAKSVNEKQIETPKLPPLSSAEAGGS